MATEDLTTRAINRAMLQGYSGHAEDSLLYRELADALKAKDAEIAHLRQSQHQREIEPNRAEIIARLAHAGQVDKQGRPYIEHVARVVQRIPDDEGMAQTVAWLHDIVEDTGLSSTDLTTLGFGPDIVEAVDLLTRTAPFAYKPYIERIATSGNRIARMVKMADLRDHLEPDALPSLRPRYEAALRRLEDQVDRDA